VSTLTCVFYRTRGKGSPVNAEIELRNTMKEVKQKDINLKWKR